MAGEETDELEGRELALRGVGWPPELFTLDPNAA
jgi:hypothetical protein